MNIIFSIYFSLRSYYIVFSSTIDSNKCIFIINDDYPLYQYLSLELILHKGLDCQLYLYLNYAFHFFVSKLPQGMGLVLNIKNSKDKKEGNKYLAEKETKPNLDRFFVLVSKVCS